MAGRGKAAREATAGFAEVQADLANRSYRPVYVLEGEDAHRMEGVVAHLRDRLLEPAAQAFNYHVFNGDSADLAQVVQQALSYPLLAARQLVWLRDCDRCAVGEGREAALEKYLERPVENTVLVLTATKLDGRRRWVKRCKESGWHFHFAPPEGAALVDWVLKAAGRQQVPLDRDLAEMLCELVGSDLRALSGELEKLALAVEEAGRAPTRAQLQSLILRQRAVDPFELVRALVPGDPAPALILWRRLAAEGAVAHEVGPLMIWRVRQLALVAALLAEGRTESDVQTLAGLSPWAYRQVSQAARRWGPSQIGRALAACRRFDAALKGSPLRPDLVLEQAILDVCGLGD